MRYESLFKKVDKETWAILLFLLLSSLVFTGLNPMMFAQDLRYFRSLSPLVYRKNKHI